MHEVITVLVSIQISIRSLQSFFFFKQKTAYEIYQCDWSSDVCSSDLGGRRKKPAAIWPASVCVGLTIRRGPKISWAKSRRDRKSVV